MGFDKEAEGREQLRKLELFFDSGRSEHSLPMPPIAYIGLGSFFTSRDNRPMLTIAAASYDELKAQVDQVKADLDALLAEAKARFRIANSN